MVKQEEIEQQSLYPKKIEKGYIHIKVDNVWVLEHRFIVEEYIGRKLNKKEVVHHDNFNKLDNRINNLTLFPNGSSHNHFHRQIKQFGFTNPRLNEIKQLKADMIVKHLKNMN